LLLSCMAVECERFPEERPKLSWRITMQKHRMHSLHV